MKCSVLKTKGIYNNYMKTCTIFEFFDLSKMYPVIDVRSPQEFADAHIPHAYNVPLFSDDQRAVVGTIYKKRGKQEAITIGLEFVGPQLIQYLMTVETICAEKNTKTIIVYCARGGMRSKSFAMFLACSGYTVYQLIGGFKAFKNYLSEQTNKPYKCTVLGGTTGSGKTELLALLAQQGEQVIDLEALAHHKGSAFGSLGELQQPTQAQFIINCLLHLMACDNKKTIWIEKESYKIGNLSIPTQLWNLLKSAPIIYITTQKEERLNNLVDQYARHNSDDIQKCIMSLAKKLGGFQTCELCTAVCKKDYRTVASKLLDYYDAQYIYSLQKNRLQPLTHISFIHESAQERVDILKKMSCNVL